MDDIRSAGSRYHGSEPIPRVRAKRRSARFGGAACRTLLLSLGVAGSTPAVALELAAAGRARVDIRLARGAIPAERTAASELASYLGRVASARFVVGAEFAGSTGPISIHVGPTRFAREHGIDCRAMGPEQWRVSATDAGVILCGGRPRGTLYAVYHFLERAAGVRWWTPAAESVPRRKRLKVGRLDMGGNSAFAYRDIHGDDAAGLFYVRNRVNGHFVRLGEEYGGTETYGPPRMVHTFYDYVPPDEFFETRPELFSEVGGMRYGGAGQLCLTQPGLVDLVAQRMAHYIERGEANSSSAPRLYNFSQNDWFKPCECAACSAVVEREGSQSGPLIEMLNQLAERIVVDHPEVLIDTLAYGYTFEPPAGLSARDNIVVRLSALYDRDFSRPISDPVNARFRSALGGWSERTKHLRIWDYPVMFGPDGDLPLPNLSVLAADFRLYLDQGVEGVFVQHWFPLAGDMRALKRWVVTRLLENPAQPLDDLVVEFTDGYYGAAGRPIRSYLDALARAAARRPSRIGFSAAAEDYAYLEPQFLERAQAYFDRAEQRVRDAPILLQRVRRARLSLDRATLTRWADLRAVDGARLDLEATVRRYRDTWRILIGRNVARDGRAAARNEVEREIDYWTGAERP